jgi:transcriptional regulator with XRE-family HTH domain
MTNPLKAARLSAGWSQPRLAYELRKLAQSKRIGVASAASLKTQISRWENGHVLPVFYQPLLCELFKITPSELGFIKLPTEPEKEPRLHLGAPDVVMASDSVHLKVADDMSQITINDLTGSGAYEKSDPISAARSAGDELSQWNNSPSHSGGQVFVLTAKQIGLDELKLLEATVSAFRAWDHQYGGGLRRKAVLGQLNELAELLRQPHPRPLRRRLFSVASQLAIVAAHMSADSHYYGVAYLYLDLALESARESSDANLGARAANATARQLLGDGYVTESLTVLDQAQKSLQGLSQENAALLLTSKAWAYAHSGSYDPMARALNEASELLVNEPAPGLFGPAEIAGVSGACFEMLALAAGAARTNHAKRAEEYILRALNARDPIYARSRVLDLVGLANVHLSLSEPEMAMESGVLALEGATRLRSGRTVHRIHALAVRALDDFPGVPLVHDFAENVRCRLPVP